MTFTYTRCTRCALEAFASTMVDGACRTCQREERERRAPRVTYRPVCDLDARLEDERLWARGY